MLIFLMAFLVLAVGGVSLQFFLSRRESKWPGLILPGITLLVSLIALVSVMGYSAPSAQVVIDGAVVEQSSRTALQLSRETVLTMLSSFALYNVPTVLLLCVYAGCRSAVKRRKSLDIMSIQDLG